MVVQARLNIGFQFRIKPCWSNLGLNYKCYMRPCKIWEPYSDHWVEKSLGPKSKYVGPPKKGKKIIFGICFKQCKSFGMVLFFCHSRVLCQELGLRVQFLGVLKLHSLSSHIKIFLKSLGVLKCCGLQLSDDTNRKKEGDFFLGKGKLCPNKICTVKFS